MGIPQELGTASGRIGHAPVSAAEGEKGGAEMTNLFFLLCWWIGVFTRPSSIQLDAFAKVPILIEYARFTPKNKFILNDDHGKPLAIISLKTGKVKLFGNPNEAARRFWDAVEVMGGMRMETNK